MTHQELKRELRKALSPADVEAEYGIPRGSQANLRWAKRGPKYYRRPGGRGIFYLRQDIEKWLLSQPVPTLDSIETERGESR
jgi:hypothetical protein